MKTLLSIFVLFMLLFVFPSCEKKPLPETENNEPVFYFKCNVQGSQINLSAGEENYYMSSSHYLDTTNVYVFKADLKQTNCNSGCGYAVTILINNKVMTPSSESININTALQPGSYEFNDKNITPLYYIAKLQPTRREGPVNEHTWLIADRQAYSYTASELVQANTIFSPTLSFSNIDGSCSIEHVNTFDVGNPLKVSVIGSKTVQTNVLEFDFASSCIGTAPFTYTWDFGDGTSVSNEANPKHIYATQGYYTAVLTVRDANNRTCTTRYQVPAYVDGKCEANYTATFVPLPNTKGYSAVTIILTDPSGNVYSSKDLAQPSNSGFEIISSDDYMVNEKGEPTRRIKIKLNCTLQNGNDKLILENAEAVIAVSYK